MPEVRDRGSLPRPLSSFVGREAEVAAARARLVERRARLLTLLGPGGVGKTRLAIRLAEVAAAAYPDGVVFVPLAAIDDAELVIPAVVQALGVQALGEHGATDTLVSYLHGRNILLVLDNFEQVQPAAAAVAALLVACPEVAVLATSRVPLRIAGEQRLPVAPLMLPPARLGDAATGDAATGDSLSTIAAAAAVQLFVDRAQAIDPGFALDRRNAAAVAAICRRVDGLPLAIELAAARTQLLDPVALHGRLGPALPLLNSGPDDAPDRLRTMSNAIAWSYDLLTADEQRLLRRLSVFVGGFSLDAAEAVGSRQSDVGGIPSDPTPDPRPPDSVLDLVASLVDKSLLQRMPAAGESRFSMLETIREFALEQLAASGEAVETASRHAAWFVALAATVRQSGRLSHRDGLALLEREHPNLRAALAWLLERGEVDVALHLMGELAEFWLRHGHWVEGKAWLERALAADAGAPTGARATALVGLAMLLWARRDFAGSRLTLAQAESIARETGDAGALAYARLHQGYAALFSGDLALAAARGEECVRTCQAIPQEFSCNGALFLLAGTTLALGQDDRARGLYERLMAAGQTDGDDISVANALLGLALLAERRGEVAQALLGWAEAALICRLFGDVMLLGQCFDYAGMNAAEIGRPEPATRWLSVAAGLYASVGVPGDPGFHATPDRLERAMMIAREALGEAVFARTWDAGSALSVDEAITEIFALARGAGTADGSAPAAPSGVLTPREGDVLRLLVRGWSDKEIATELGIGRRTVSTHVSTIRTKLGASSRSAAAAIAARDGLT